MSRAQFTNNAQTTLSAGINNSVTSMSVATGEGALFPSPGTDYFYCTLAEGSLLEIVKVTARTTDTFTIVRAQEGTTAQAFTTAATVYHDLTAAAIAELQDIASKDATGGYAGLTLFKINFKNAANTFLSWFTNSNTAARTYTFQDRDGTIADLGANTFTGNQTLGGNKIINPLLEKTLELRASPAISAGVLALDLANGISAVALNANITSITFANNAASATACQSHTLEFTADGTPRTVAWPAGDGTTTLLVKWVGGTAPTLTSTNAKRDTFIFKSVSQFLFDAYVVGQNS